MDKSFLTKLAALDTVYSENVPMKDYTTFKTGGNADIMIFPESISALQSVTKLCVYGNIPYFVLGRGSNLLVGDGGIRQPVINTERLTNLTVCDDEIVCGAGVPLLKLCNFAKDNSLSGLEFAFGIPGSTGGAFYMNAGAYGGEIADVAKSAVCVDKNGDIVEIALKNMCFGYRTSVFKTKALTICEVRLKLRHGVKEEIEERMNGFFARRKEKQPLEYPSAGSTFKRPSGYFAGALIEKNGLKGTGIGGAEVSRKHAGFIINKGNATSKDIKALIEKVSKTVLENDGVELEPEVVFIGEA